MKTFLIVFTILVLLGVVIFLLMRKPEKVIDDNSIVIPDSDSDTKPSFGFDVDKSSVETDKSDIQDVDNNKEVCLQEGVDYSKESEKVVEETEETEEEVHIPEHCKPQEDPVDNLPNKYFFNIHKYTTARNRPIYCVVCSALIKGHNYRTIVRNSFYPYIGSYTKTLCSKIVSKYSDSMTVEEFLKTGSNKFDRVGKIVDSLPYIY